METKKFLDQEGLSFLWEKLSLQDYPNNDTLVAIIDAIDKNKADKSEIKQSDWNQSNDSSIDYIKNKPQVLTINDVISIPQGGTGAINAESARNNLGFSTETWTFTLANGNSITKTVVLI